MANCGPPELSALAHQRRADPDAVVRLCAAALVAVTERTASLQPQLGGCDAEGLCGAVATLLLEAPLDDVRLQFLSLSDLATVARWCARAPSLAGSAICAAHAAAFDPETPQPDADPAGVRAGHDQLHHDAQLAFYVFQAVADQEPPGLLRLQAAGSDVLGAPVTRQRQAELTELAYNFAVLANDAAAPPLCAFVRLWPEEVVALLEAPGSTEAYAATATVLRKMRAAATARMAE